MAQAPKQTAPDHSPDESINAGGSVQVTRIGVPPAKDLILWFLVGVSLAGNVFNWYYSHDAKTQAWLAEDATEKLQSGPVADLRSQMQTNYALINAYGLREQCQR